MKLSLKIKLVLATTLTGIVPATIIGWLALRSASTAGDEMALGYQHIAENISDKLDRNLFERYGDVQAFGANDAVNDTNSWYQIGSDKNKIAAAANRYANLYGFYLLGYVVDLEGKVIAVNDKDPAGKAIDTAWLYEKNFKDAEWFKESLAGNFLKSDVLNGTFVQDLHADEDVKKAYGTAGLVLGFSAPFTDATGKVIGVWHNCANFSLVEEIVVAAYKGLKADGFTQAEVGLVDATGRVLMNYAPAHHGGKEAVEHNLQELLKLNLAEQGSESARAVITGKSGHVRENDVEGHGWEICAYSPCDGVLGFPGLKWGVLVRVPERQALAAMHDELRQIAIVIGLSALALVGAGWWLARSISKPLLALAENLKVGAEETAAAAGQVSTASQHLAEGASEQAASLEETGASLEEMSSMVKRNAQNVVSAKEFTAQTRKTAELSAASTHEMGEAMAGIKSASEEMRDAMNGIKTASVDVAKIIKTIDEIAFQTNILALNAAVEAARAGDAGLGFAVVADEVRNLAQRSAKAAKDTADMIETSLKRSEQGVLVTNKVTAAVEQVTTRSRQLGTRLAEIQQQAQQVDEQIAQVASAATEQSQGISQVNIAVSQMDKLTQSNAASAEQTASASEELSAQAEQMRGAASELRLLVSGERTGSTAEAATRPGNTKGNPAPASSSPTPRPVIHQRVKPTRKAPASPAARGGGGEAMPMPAMNSGHHSTTLPAAGDFRDF